MTKSNESTGVLGFQMRRVECGLRARFPMVGSHCIAATIIFQCLERGGVIWGLSRCMNCGLVKTVIAGVWFLPAVVCIAGADALFESRSLVKSEAVPTLDV